MSNKDVRDNVPHLRARRAVSLSQMEVFNRVVALGKKDFLFFPPIFKSFCIVERMNVGLHLTGNVGSAPGNTRHSVITRLTNAHMKSH